MQCEAVRELWLAAHYERQAPRELDASVREHIASCAQCAAFVAAQRELDALLLRADPAEAVHVGPAFDTRFFGRLDGARRQAAWTRRKRAFLWLTPLAAAAAFALFLLPHRRHEQPPMAAEDLALTRDLELVEDLPLLRRLDEVEAYPTLSHVNEAELNALIAEDTP